LFGAFLIKISEDLIPFFFSYKEERLALKVRQKPFVDCGCIFTLCLLWENLCYLTVSNQIPLFHFILFSGNEGNSIQYQKIPNVSKSRCQKWSELQLLEVLAYWIVKVCSAEKYFGFCCVFMSQYRMLSYFS